MPISLGRSLRTLGVLGLSAIVASEAPAQTRAQPQDVIRLNYTVVTTDVVVRNAKSGKFLSDLKRSDFEVFEDGVKQDVVTFVRIFGGKVFYDTPPSARPAVEGILLPPPRPPNDGAGRVLLIFIDDLHLDPSETPRLKSVFQMITKELIHEGDQFGIVSTGPSSVAIDMTYDLKRLDEALKKISGGGLTPSEILAVREGQDGQPEVKHRAHVAFSTAYEVLKNLEQIHDRRKAFVYVSGGYDLSPFSVTRAKNDAERDQRPKDSSGVSDVNPFAKDGGRFSAADLAAQLSELTRQANRANATIYTIDPRGLMAGTPIEERVDAVDWQDHLTTMQNSLRVLAEQTGGIAVVGTNDIPKALRQIDADTSDYYVLGFYASRTDPSRRDRAVEIKVKRPGAVVKARPGFSTK